jgi:hypothetical protein
MADPDPGLLDRAASCFLRLGDVGEAARCYRDAGSFRRAADLYAGLGRHEEAADAYALAGLRDLAAWHLVHYAGRPAAARACLADGAPNAAPDAAPVATPVAQRLSLRRDLIIARCEVAEGLPHTRALRTLETACAQLERTDLRIDFYVEPWAVALAGSMRREDQVALVFAAAVRGRRPGAARRWGAWSREALHCELILPTGEPGSSYPSAR